MSKLEILQRTINYIKDLTDALDQGVPTSPTTLANAELPKRPRAKRSKGKKLFKGQENDTVSDASMMSNTKSHNSMMSEHEENREISSQYSTNSYTKGPTINYPDSINTDSSKISVQPLPWQAQVEVNSSIATINAFSSCQHSVFPAQQQPNQTEQYNSTYQQYPTSIHSPVESLNSSYTYASHNSHNKGHITPHPDSFMQPNQLDCIGEWIESSQQAMQHYNNSNVGRDYSWISDTSSLSNYSFY